MRQLGSVDILAVREFEEGSIAQRPSDGKLDFGCASRQEIAKARFPGEKKPSGRSGQNDKFANGEPNGETVPPKNEDVNRAGQLLGDGIGNLIA